MAQTEMEFERAAALFWALGGSVPHAPELEEWALQETSGGTDREKLLLKAVNLCSAGETPAHCYLLTKLYSWLGPQYTADTIRWASRYLSGRPWEKLPRGITLQDGVEISRESAARAGVYADLAQAQVQRGETGPAMVNYGEAYRLEPYNAMYPVKVADLLSLSGSTQEALQYLENQKASRYYKPVRYTDARGVRHTNDTFRQLLDAQIRKLKARISQ